MQCPIIINFDVYYDNAKKVKRKRRYINRSHGENGNLLHLCVLGCKDEKKLSFLLSYKPDALLKDSRGLTPIDLLYKKRKEESYPCNYAVLLAKFTSRQMKDKRRDKILSLFNYYEQVLKTYGLVDDIIYKICEYLIAI